MKKNTILCLAILCATSIPTFNISASEATNISEEINFHNRPLMKVNGKTISLIDIIKRMDLQLLKQMPHILNDPSAKIQYYSSSWRLAFNELVEQELILLDSEQLKFSISEADVREELQNSFGSNLISKLDSIGLTLEEAKKMTEHDMVVRQMLWFKAYSKALQEVTPGMIKQTYAQVTKDNLLKQKDQWCYQILTVKCKDDIKGEKIANEAYNLLTSSRSLINTIPEALKNTFLQSSAKSDFEVLLSKDITVDSQSISKAHFEVLNTLKEQEYSKPITQQIKNTKETVHRIFYLKNHNQQQTQKFEDIAQGIKDKLIQSCAEKEKKQYIDALKLKFFVSDNEIVSVIPKDYEPFALIQK